MRFFELAFTAALASYYVAPTAAILPKANRVKLALNNGAYLSLFEVKVISDGKNAALGKTASQGSTFNNNSKYSASNAVDGMDSGLFSHTADTNVWWEVDLNGTFEIDQVLIKNRYCVRPDDPNGCLCRLSNASLMLLSDKGECVDGVLLGNTCKGLDVVHNFTTPSQSICLNAHSVSKADRVKISSNTGAYLNLFEVKVISDGKNVALGKTARQGSTYKGIPTFNASNAVDGMDSGLFSHTADTNVWWEVDLNGTFEIDQVLIKNRYCGGPDDPIGCLCRLSHASLMLLSDKGDWVDGVLLGNTCKGLEVVQDFPIPSPSTCTAQLTNETSPTPTLVAKLTASNRSAHDRFGSSVAISGTTLVVGAYWDDSEYGSAYVYQYNKTSNVWDQAAKLTASDGHENQWFGVSVAISRTTIVVGTYYTNYHTNDPVKGAAYIYQYNETSTRWDEVAKLTASDTYSHPSYGLSVAIWGTTVVVGAPYQVSGMGNVYVYQYNETSTHWDEISNLTAPLFRDESDYFGSSVAINDTTLVVGAYGELSMKGGAYVFQYNKTLNSWARVAILRAFDASSRDRFGISVAISGTTIVVGTDHDFFKGAAYVYKYNETSTHWHQGVVKLTPSDGDTRDLFGHNVAISGTTVVVGAQVDDSYKGSAYVYKYNETLDVWDEVAKLTAYDGYANDRFGSSVAISGSTAVIGAYGDDDERGSAYVAKV